MIKNYINLLNKFFNYNNPLKRFKIFKHLWKPTQYNTVKNPFHKSLKK